VAVEHTNRDLRRAFLISQCELPRSLGVTIETGWRHDTKCAGRALFDANALHGKDARYSLTAHWDDALPVLFGIGFNPSTARAEKGDRTVNRVIRAAQRSGKYGAIFWINLAAQMETNAKTFITEGRASGQHNARQIEIVLEHLHPAEGARDVLLAWGGDGPKIKTWLANIQRDGGVRFLSFGQTVSGRPLHPSRLRRAQMMSPISY